MNISAIIPAYNAETYIRQTIMSLLNLSVPVYEIIIVDDGSTDKTGEIVSRIQEQYEGIRLVKQANSGVSSARNSGVKLAEGDWVLLLDSDDVCDSSLIESYLDFIDTNECAAIYSQFVQIDENNELISNVITGTPLLGEDGFVQMLLRNPIISPSGSIIKKSVFHELKGFDCTIKYGEDVDFWLRLLLAGYNIAHVSKPLSFIRRHANNTTANMETTRIGESHLLKKFGLMRIKELIYKRKKLLVENHLDYAQFLIRFAMWEEARELLNSFELTEVDKCYVSYVFSKAVVEIECHNYEYALLYFREIIEVQPEHSASLNNLGVLYALKKEIRRADTLFRQALQHHPQYLDAKHNIEQMNQFVPEYRFTKRELRKNLLKYT